MRLRPRCVGDCSRGSRPTRTCLIAIKLFSEEAERCYISLVWRTGCAERSYQTSELSVSTHKVEQRRLSHRGREFHFVSYDAQIANERRGQPAIPAMWYLMIEGKRRPVLPHVPGQELMELDGALLQWVDEEVFGGSLPVRAQRRR